MCEIRQKTRESNSMHANWLIKQYINLIGTVDLAMCSCTLSTGAKTQRQKADGARSDTVAKVLQFVVVPAASTVYVRGTGVFN